MKTFEKRIAIFAENRSERLSFSPSPSWRFLFGGALE